MAFSLKNLMLSKEHFPTSPLIAELWRGEVLESQHQVHAVLVNENGKVLAYRGDPELSTTARSALKPFQLWAGLKQGTYEHYGFTDRELALMCASHNGEPFHIEACSALLEKINCVPTDLECGVHPPYHSESADEILHSGASFSALHNNCSGKHCGLLAFRAYLNAEGSYLDPMHPTQKAIFDALRQLLQVERTFAIGVDGCSLPTPALHLKELAHLFAQLAAARSPAVEGDDPYLEKIFQSMNAAPELVAGTGRFDTAIMRDFPQQIVSKVGGEAIRGFALRTPDGARYGMALKVLDGAMRALHPACLAFLAQCGLIDLHQISEALSHFIRYPEKNWNGIEVTQVSIQ